MAKVETMPQAETKVPVTIETKPTAAPMAMQVWRPFENLRREIDRMFEEFSAYPFRLPLRRPAVRHRAFLASGNLGDGARDRLCRDGQSL